MKEVSQDPPVKRQVTELEATIFYASGFQPFHTYWARENRKRILWYIEVYFLESIIYNSILYISFQG